MQGTIIKLDINGQTSRQEVTSPDILDIAKEIVGGWIEVVPLFDKYKVNGKEVECVAFCNEEGKLESLPINIVATKLWYDRLDNLGYEKTDVLVGNIAVVFGDTEFMKQL